MTAIKLFAPQACMVAASLALGGCAHPYWVTARLADGEVLQGQGTADTITSRASLSGDRNLRCEQTGANTMSLADIWDNSITCADGRSARFTVRRTSEGGIPLWRGDGTFSNGMPFTWVEANHKQAIDQAAAGYRAMAAAPSPTPAQRRAAPPPEPRQEPAPALRPSYPVAPPRPDDVAVIIGNGDYRKQSKDIPDVTPAHADAESVRHYAVNALGIREGNVIFMKDATGSQLARVFGSEKNHRGQLFDWVKPGRSRVFVYYSGHGAPGEDGGAYLVPADADATRIDINGYPLAVLYGNLARLPAESVTVVLESCFSGSSPAGSVISNASPVFLKAKGVEIPSGLTVITAGAANQMASWTEDKANGLFTRHFLLGMAGEADKRPFGNGDGKIDPAELDAYLKDTLTYTARRLYGREQQAQISPARR